MIFNLKKFKEAATSRSLSLLCPSSYYKAILQIFPLIQLKKFYSASVGEDKNSRNRYYLLAW